MSKWGLVELYPNGQEASDWQPYPSKQAAEAEQMRLWKLPLGEGGGGRYQVREGTPEEIADWERFYEEAAENHARGWADWDRFLKEQPGPHDQQANYEAEYDL